MNIDCNSVAVMPSAGQNDSPNFKDYAASAGAWRVISAVDTTRAKLAAFAYCQVMLASRATLSLEESPRAQPPA